MALTRDNWSDIWVYLAPYEKKILGLVSKDFYYLLPKEMRTVSAFDFLLLTITRDISFPVCKAASLTHSFRQVSDKNAVETGEKLALLVESGFVPTEETFCYALRKNFLVLVFYLYNIFYPEAVSQSFDVSDWMPLETIERSLHSTRYMYYSLPTHKGT